ncbi:MAG: DUF3577 domain-containing protein [Candidatus Methylumidiphilus sp.]
MSDNSENNPARYFDLHVTGLGYLNRAREVKVPRGQPFLAVGIAALHGATEAVEKTWFDARVSGQEAQKVVRELMPDIEANKSVLVGFKLGDLTPETFVYEKGPKAGQTGVSLKARLLRIAWAKVDGKTVYTAPKDGTATDAKQGPPLSEAA